MKLKGIAINQPVADLRVFVAPETRLAFLSPELAQPHKTYLHGFGVAGDRKLRIPWRPHEAVFFDCKGALSLPEHLPDGNPGASVTRSVRRLYLDCGIGLRFDLSTFTNPIHRYPTSSGVPIDWINRCMRQKFVFIDKDIRKNLLLPSILKRMVTKFARVSTPHDVWCRSDLLQPLQPQLILLAEADAGELNRYFRLPLYPVDSEHAIHLGAEEISLEGFEHRLCLTYIINSVGYLARMRAERQWRFEQLRLTRAFAAWLHTDIELLRLLVSSIRKQGSWIPTLAPAVLDLRESIENLAAAAIPSNLSSQNISAPFAARKDSVLRSSFRLLIPEGSQSYSLEVAQRAISRKRRLKSYDVFVCYNRRDGKQVEAIIEKLEKSSILPWFDKAMRPGTIHSDEINRQIDKIPCVAVFIGEFGLGPYQSLEVGRWIARYTTGRQCRIIPVVLPGGIDPQELPGFLGVFHAVDFRGNEAKALGDLIHGIRGDLPQRT